MNTSAITLEGKYFDGRQPIGTRAKLLITGGETNLISEQTNKYYLTKQLCVSPKIGSADRFIALPDGSQFQCSDQNPLDRLPQDSKAEGIVAWLEARVSIAVTCIFIIVALNLLGYFYGLPAAAERIAFNIPIETEQTLGKDVLDWLDQRNWFNETEVEKTTQLSIREDFKTLTTNLPLQHHYRLEFRNAKAIGANAFALPGGIIVITDDLIHLSDSFDEIAAILAHEIAHVERRHTMRHVLQDSAVAVVITTVTGDAASLSVAVAGLPTVLARAKYSRDFETEADGYAFQLLKQHNISPNAFATMMERLMGKHDDVGKHSFLSTHPMTRERIKRARNAAKN